MPAATAAVPYDVRLDHIEACNCPPNCPCQFGGLPTHGACQFLIGFHIQQGTFGGVKLDGAKFVVIALYPGAIHQGHGTGVLYVDEKLSDAQVDAIAQILSGKHGGMPWEALATTFASVEGPIRSKLEMTINGTRSSFRVPGEVDLQQTPIKDNVSGADKEVHIVYPKGGFFWNDGNVCTTQTMSVTHGKIRFDHSGCYSAHAIAHWTNGR